MKSITHLICILSSLLASPLLAGDMPLQTGKGHRFACTDYTGGNVFIVNADGNVEWEYKTGSCNDLWVLPNGNLLFNTGTGVQEVTRDRKIVFDYKGSPFKRTVKQKDGTTKQVEGPSEIYACQRLANGNTFIGECNTGRLLVVAPDGKIVKEVRLLPEGRDGGHAYIRNARLLANGNYLVTHNGEQAVREYDSQGKLVREIPAAGGPHSAIRLPNGNTLISCGDRPGGHRVFEVDAAGKIVWEVKGDELPGISLKFMAGLQRLPNGNTVMSNWLGHKQFGNGPHLIEVTPNKQVVWTFADHKTMKTISSIQLLDVPGDAIQGGIMH
ncbi:MAG: hypothetical protein HZA88_21510 [Verrucomicrobia bacterium]|nr:hypothetical protein [Verrucomicrobiota bacterium]